MRVATVARERTYGVRCFRGGGAAVLAESQPTRGNKQATKCPARMAYSASAEASATSAAASPPALASDGKASGVASELPAPPSDGDASEDPCDTPESAAPSDASAPASIR